MASMSGSMSSSPNSTMMMMTPYLHFTRVDALYFLQWQPTSSGAIAGACIGLIFLALFDRWLAATRSLFAEHWRRRAYAFSSTRDQSVATQKIASNFERESTEKADFSQSNIEEVPTQASGPFMEPKVITITSRLRSITPFIAAHDIPRGILYGLQMLIMYLLMLAVMTFQAAFLISIVLGLGIGEMLFGRAIGIGGGH